MCKPERKRLSVHEVDALVTGYKQGTPGASEQLVDAFEGFIVKFLNLINKGECDLNDKALRNFLSLFAGASVHQFRHNLNVLTNTIKMIGLIQQQFSRYEREEIKNELVMVFLKMAKRYKSPHDTDPYFHTYVQKVFHFHVFKAFQKLIADPLMYANGTQSAPFNDNQMNEDDEPDHDEVDAAPTSTLRPSLDTYVIDESLEADDSYLDENWINGLGVSKSFEGLSSFDRRILKYSYVDELDDNQIAEHLGTCRATVIRRRIMAERVIFQERDRAKMLRSDEDYRTRTLTDVAHKSRSPRVMEDAEKRVDRKLKRWTGDVA